MRSELIDYFKSLKLKNYRVSDELPFDQSGNPLYVKNPKTVYTDLRQSTQEQVIAILGNHGIFHEIHSISVFFTTDAKNLPSDYSTTVDNIQAARDVEVANQPYFRREVDISTEYLGDLMVTQFDFRFTKIR